MALTSIPFAEVVAKVAQLGEGNHDETFATSALQYVQAEDHPFGALVVGGDEGDTGDVMPLTGLGFRAMTKQLSVPAKYMQRLETDEAVRHINMWLRDDESSWQLRLNAVNGVRSVQKAGFTPIDILPTLEAIQPVIEESGMVVTHVVPGLEDFHLRCVWPDSHGGSADPLHAGFHLNATEANLHLFTVDAACYRTSCLNTAILRRGKALFSQRHYFLNFDEFRPRLLEGLVRAEQVGVGLCNALARCRDQAMPAAAMDKELRRLLNLNALPKRFVEQAVEAVEEGRVEEYNLAGLINLLTREAQEFGQGERKFHGRMRVEGVAGRMLLEHMGSTIANSPPSGSVAVAEPEVSDETAEALPESVTEDVEQVSTSDTAEQAPSLEDSMRSALNEVSDEDAEEKPKKKKNAASKPEPASKKKKKRKKVDPEPEVSDDDDGDEAEAEEVTEDATEVVEEGEPEIADTDDDTFDEEGEEETEGEDEGSDLDDLLDADDDADDEEDMTDVDDAAELDDDETAEQDEEDAEDAEEDDVEEDDEEEDDEEEDDEEEDDEDDEEDDDGEDLDDLDDLEPVEA